MLKTMSFAQKTQEEWIANLVNKVMSSSDYIYPPDYVYRDGNAYQIKRELCFDDKVPDMILKSKKMQELPQDALNDFVEEIGYYADDYNEYIPQIQFLNCKEISDAGKRFIKENWEAVEQWTHEHIFYFYDPADFEDQDVCVNLVLATDRETNSDMAAYQAMNYWGGYSGKLESDSALVWIADQFSEKENLLKVVRETCADNPDGDYVDREKANNPFIESVIQELENFSSCMGAFTFLLRMSLEDFIKLKKMQKLQKGSLLIKPSVMCGIFAPWTGGGSVLGVELPHELHVPASMIWDAWIDGSKMHGYDIDEVYCMCKSAWKPAMRLED